MGRVCLSSLLQIICCLSTFFVPPVAPRVSSGALSPWQTHLSHVSNSNTCPRSHSQPRAYEPYGKSPADRVALVSLKGGGEIYLLSATAKAEARGSGFPCRVSGPHCLLPPRSIGRKLQWGGGDGGEVLGLELRPWVWDVEVPSSFLTSVPRFGLTVLQ